MFKPKKDNDIFINNKNTEYLEKMVFCESYLDTFDKCLKNRKSTHDDIRQSFHNLVNCEKKHGVNVYN